MENERLKQQIEFIVEIDKLKRVMRQSRIIGDIHDELLWENSAEHSWHFAMLAVILGEYADKTVDIGKVMKMALIHDIVEIDAGDTFAYDQLGHLDKAEREGKAASRIFGLLPDNQRDEMMELWMEFEERETNEAQFAAALDLVQPLLQNYYTQGYSWQKNKVTSDQVLARINAATKNSKTLKNFVEWLIHDAVKKGYLQ
ncbi:HD domain-containing protein [Niallia endozanthoxylica]|uniref:HD domain-containing protein n=1 Tax=Niallia endozanthoxylica TaxID=2036016 RepID=A0A5J5HQW3_9BACI|nr:HD domain-containing protein [Niallia endozanthoxylica]KAA9023645.1 HD domain-containing protein [Niallia endozanthoxylica]